jgi:hypothetical protein
MDTCIWLSKVKAHFVHSPFIQILYTFEEFYFKKLKWTIGPQLNLKSLVIFLSYSISHDILHMKWICCHACLFSKLPLSPQWSIRGSQWSYFLFMRLFCGIVVVLKELYCPQRTVCNFFMWWDWRCVQSLVSKGLVSTNIPLRVFSLSP